MEEMIVKEEKHEVSPFADSQSFQKIFDIGKMFATSQLVPQNYQGKPMDCTIAVDMANRMGVSPMMVMQNLYVVKGKPTWSGQACMSMIRANTEFKNVRPVYDGTPHTDNWGCRIEAEYKDSGEKIKGTTVTIEMAKKEGMKKQEVNGKPCRSRCLHIVRLRSLLGYILQILLWGFMSRVKQRTYQKVIQE